MKKYYTHSLVAVHAPKTPLHIFYLIVVFFVVYFGPCPHLQYKEHDTPTTRRMCFRTPFLENILQKLEENYCATRQMDLERVMIVVVSPHHEIYIYQHHIIFTI